MSWWKQTIACVVIVLASAALWYNFVPGAKQIAASWGFGEATTAEGPQGGSPGPTGGMRPAGASGIIIMERAAAATSRSRRSAIGTGTALHTVAVRPYTSRRLTDSRVEPASEVRMGAVIARMDSAAERIALDR